MSFTVEWRPSAEQLLADLWNNALDRADVAAAADAIDAALARDPLGLGEARGGATRIVFQPPLAPLYDVDVSRRTVMVWDVFRWPSSPRPR
jgi:hypothetical protein